MIKIAICDDEPNIRHYLAALIQKQGISHETEVTEYAFLTDYLACGAGTDLLFLDIEMPQEPDGVRKAGAENALPQGRIRNGMELARRIRDTDAFLQPLIIFVTGYEKYVYDAFDVDAFQYLLKPVDEQRFSEVFARAVERILAKQSRQPRIINRPHKRCVFRQFYRPASLQYLTDKLGTEKIMFPMIWNIKPAQQQSNDIKMVLVRFLYNLLHFPYCIFIGLLTHL